MLVDFVDLGQPSVGEASRTEQRQHARGARVGPSERVHGRDAVRPRHPDREEHSDAYAVFVARGVTHFQSCSFRARRHFRAGQGGSNSVCNDCLFLGALPTADAGWFVLNGTGNTVRQVTELLCWAIPDDNACVIYCPTPLATRTVTETVIETRDPGPCIAFGGEQPSRFTGPPGSGRFCFGDCTFLNLGAGTTEGGGINANGADCIFEVSRCSFRSCTTRDFGGGIEFGTNDGLVLTRSCFGSCWTTSDAYRRGEGGGVDFKQTSGADEVNQNSASGCNSTYDGGGFRVGHVPYVAAVVASAKMQDSNFTKCQAGVAPGYGSYGGAIAIADTTTSEGFKFIIANLCGSPRTGRATLRISRNADGGTLVANFFDSLFIQADGEKVVYREAGAMYMTRCGFIATAFTDAGAAEVVCVNCLFGQEGLRTGNGNTVGVPTMFPMCWLDIENGGLCAMAEVVPCPTSSPDESATESLAKTPAGSETMTETPTFSVAGPTPAASLKETLTQPPSLTSRQTNPETGFAATPAETKRETPEGFVETSTETTGPDDEGGGSNLGAIVGGVVGGVAAVAIAGVIVFFLWKKSDGRVGDEPDETRDGQTVTETNQSNVQITPLGAVDQDANGGLSLSDSPLGATVPPPEFQPADELQFAPVEPPEFQPADAPPTPPDFQPAETGTVVELAHTSGRRRKQKGQPERVVEPTQALGEVVGKVDVESVVILKLEFPDERAGLEAKLTTQIDGVGIVETRDAGDFVHVRLRMARSTEYSGPISITLEAGGRTVVGEGSLKIEKPPDAPADPSTVVAEPGDDGHRRRRRRVKET